MNKNKIYVYSGFLLVFIGLALILFRYSDEKIDIAYDMMNQKINIDKKENIEEKGNETSNTSDDLVSNPPRISDENIDNDTYYIGYLEIPRISLYRGFTNKDSTANDISVNVEIHQKSSFPGEKAGNVIFSAHSGTNYNAYFKDLYKLEEGDKAYIYYNDIKYTYIIDNIYNVPKVGKASIYRDKNKNTLTLITCTYNDESAQTIYIAYQEKKEKY